MRSRLLPSLLLALLAVPLSIARAQPGSLEVDPETDGADPADETEAAEVVDEEQVPEEAQASGGREAAPGETHTVTRGDTLWDLSQRYLGSPWYWPKVWSYNPEIANPHWIYPGNLVRFFPGGDEVPARVDVAEAPTGFPEGGEIIGGESDEDLAVPSAFGPASGEELVQVTGKMSYEPVKGRRVVHEGFVTAREVEEAGRIDSSFSEAQMLSYPDTVYVRFRSPQGAKVGDRYVIFRTETSVNHPVTGKRVGYLTKLLGTMRVVKVFDKLVTAQVLNTWDEVTRSDLVGPYGERMAETVSPRPNEREIRGYVVTALNPDLTIYGEHHELILDKGSSDGVLPGNTFTVVRQQDLGGNFMNPAKGQDRDLPLEDVATCLAVDVKDRTTNCLLIRSIREVVPGDRVEMRVGQRTASVR